MPNRKSKRPQGHRKPKAAPQPASNVVPIRKGLPATKPPKPPEKLLKRTQAIWAAFWSADVSQLIHESDAYALERWIKAVDQRERISDAVVKSPTVEGSKGQPVLNPLAKRLAELETQIKGFEQQFGMTPKARADLGVSVGTAAMNVQKLNEMANSDEPDQDETQTDADSETIDGEAEEVEGFIDG